jgi:integrase
MAQQGQVFKLKTSNTNGDPVWAYRYRLDGRGSPRPQVGGFATRAEAQRALRRELARLRPGGRAATVTLAELVAEYLDVHNAAPATIAKLRWLLAKATDSLGAVRLVDLGAEAICAWQATLPDGHRFEATQALRQVLNRAVAWELIDVNPAKRGVDNPLRRFPEKRPFESWAEIETVAGKLGRVFGPMVVFAAATGLRPSELFALEHRDLDRTSGIVYVRRAYANGRLINTKTTRSTRAVPLQAKALDALEHLPRSDNPLLFPAPRGGRIELHSFRPRYWRPAQIAAGIEPIRRPYDLRHTYATFALRAGVSIFDLSRFMGASLAMIDRHYGHLARDGRQHAIALFDALAANDSAWTHGGHRNGSSKPARLELSRSHRVTDFRSGGRLVDVAAPKRRLSRKRKEPLCSTFDEAL